MNNAILIVCVVDAKASLFFEVERRTEVKDYPGFPAHATDYVFVDGEKVALIYERDGVEYISGIENYRLLRTVRSMEVGRALHMQCVYKAVPRTHEHGGKRRSAASWLREVAP